MANINRIFRLDSWDVKNVLSQIPELQGKKPIARGAFSAIYEGTRKNTVIKVTVDDSAYYMLNDGCVGIQHKHLPRVIKNHGEVGSVRVNHMERGVFMYEVEKLEKLKGGTDARKVACMLSDTVVSASMKYAGQYGTAYMTFNDVAHNKLLPRAIRNLAAKISDFCCNFYQASPDLHMGNMMMRSNGDLVVIDPISNAEMIKVARDALRRRLGVFACDVSQ